MRTLTMAFLAGAILSSGWAGGVSSSPVTGSGRPDAFARAGGSLTLSVPNLTGSAATTGRTAIPVRPGSGSAVTLTIPDLPPGRTLITFMTADGRVVKEVDVLPPVRGGSVFRGVTPPYQTSRPDNVLRDRIQVLLNPALDAGQLGKARAILQTYGTVSTEVLPAPAPFSSAGATVNGRSPCGGTLAEVRLRTGLSVEDALNSLLADGNDYFWYPDPISTPGRPQAQGSVQPAPPPGQVPGSFFYQEKTDVIPGTSPRSSLGQRPLRRGGLGVTIAVLDSGFTSSIDALGELTGRADIRMNALFPFDATTTYTNADDFWEGHGTQVAILAAGSRHGTAPQAQVLPIKVCAPTGEANRASCRTKDVLRGICFALHQVPPEQLVLNLSLGGTVPVNAIHATLNWAEQQGAVVVAAGGNQGLNGNPREFPAAFAQQTVGTQQQLNLLAVESVTPDLPASPTTPQSAAMWRRSTFSTQGTYTNISAPGEQLDIGHPYLYSGTSFAAPLVAGAAARVKGANLNVSTGTQGSGPAAGGLSTSSAPQTATVKAFMLDPSRTNASLQPDVRPMLNLSGY